MKILMQRVAHANVEVEGKRVASIGQGILLFLGVTHSDTMAEVNWLVNKCIHLRIFKDEEGKLNRSLLETKQEALIVSQFTLYADCKEGRRPSFTEAAAPELAKHLYEQFIEEMRKKEIMVASGIFGAKMNVSLVNEGPITLLLESP